MTARGDLLNRLGQDAFDVLVVGGGIVGAGIARDAAMRGLKVALVEQGDFASGASSKTSKLIHGGLRYLEHGQWNLVAESLRERRTLREIGHGLVTPLSLLLPVFRTSPRSTWTIRLGLALYGTLAAGDSLRWPRVLSRRKALELEPGLMRDGLQSAGWYMDCLMDDARLCLATVLQAANLGAVCCNYARVLVFTKANGRVCGAVVKDVLTGRSIEITAAAVVNATGPWSDRLRRLSNESAPSLLAPTKGTHLIVRRVARQALLVQASHGTRVFFILPWGDYSLIGTTESPVHGELEGLAATTDEVAYLLEQANRVLPEARLTERDIVSSFAGARPLLAFEGSPTSASREHRIEVDAFGLVSILGGKYTTHRLMAEQVVDGLVRTNGWKTDRCLTGQVSIQEEVSPVLLECWQTTTQRLDPDLLATWLVKYGAGVVKILQLLEREPDLAQPVCRHHPELAVELAHAIREELAVTVTDVLARRTRMAWSACQGLDALSWLHELFGRYAGVSHQEFARQLEEYHDFLGRSLAFHPLFSREPHG